MELKELKPLLPKGGITDISKKSGITQAQISRMFNGLTTKDQEKVLSITVEYLKDFENKQAETRKRLNELSKSNNLKVEHV